LVSYLLIQRGKEVRASYGTYHMSPQETALDPAVM
jgi:hypothetical protein